LTESLANNLGGEDKVIQDSIVDGSQGAGSGTGLLAVVATARNSQDAALGNKDNVAVRELLLKLAGELGLNLLETLLGRNGHKDDDGLLTGANLNLYITF
jgi:hypothetical protein